MYLENFIYKSQFKGFSLKTLENFHIIYVKLP